MWAEYKEQAAGMGCSRLEWCFGKDCRQAAQGCKGLVVTGCITGIAFTARWGLQTPWFGLFLRNGTKGEADLWTLCLPDILHNIPIISKELSHSQWVITASQSCGNTRWQKPMSLQWFLATEKLQMQVNYCFFTQAHLSSNENCKCQRGAGIECSIPTWAFSAFLDIYSKKPMK